jgi:hypothetical protein
MNKKANIFSDHSAGSRLERLKWKAATGFDKSQPKNGIVVKKDDNMSRLTALSRVRAGGYMVHPKNHIRMF